MTENNRLCNHDLFSCLFISLFLFIFQLNGTVSILSTPFIGRHDTQHNDTEHNDTQRNDTQHKGLISDIQHNDTQHNDTQHSETMPLW